jgi:hypothetical protein
MSIFTTIVVECLRFQLGMIGDELQRHTPSPDATLSKRERLLWARARGSLKAASKHLGNLSESFLSEAAANINQDDAESVTGEEA